VDILPLKCYMFVQRERMFVNNQNSEEEMTRWLERPDVQDTLSGVARSVIKYALSKRLSPSFLRRDSDWGDVNDDFWEDVRSELVIFILENRLRIQKILIPGNKNCHLYLRRAFINYWIEKTRKPVRDPQRYLYKHAADVLRSSEDFSTFVGRNRALMFGMTAGAVSIPPLSLEDIREIDLPAQTLGTFEYESVNKKKGAA